MPANFKHSLLMLGILTLASVFTAGCGENADSDTAKKDTTQELNEPEKNTAASSSSTALLPQCLSTLTLKEEPQLSFCGNLHNENCIYSYSKKDRVKYHWDKHLAIGDAHNPMKSDEQITIQDLLKIYNTISTDPNYTNGSKNVAAILMTYGLNDTDDSLIIVYTPVILKDLLAPDISPNEPSAVQRIDKYKMYYVKKDRWVIKRNNTDHVLTPITAADSARYVGNFRTKIRFRNVTGGYRGFNSTDSFKEGDIKSTFMTFQQLFRMYCDNVEQTANLQHKLKLIPASTKYKGTNHKMHIVAYYNELKDDNANDPRAASFVDLGADASQMCPPKCGEFDTKERIVKDLKWKNKK